MKNTSRFFTFFSKKEMTEKKSKILIVCASSLEADLLTGKENTDPEQINTVKQFNNSCDIIVTGVGATPTAYFLAKYANKYKAILNVGVAGSFNTDIPTKSVVVIEKDCLADYGIDDNGNFKHFSNFNFVSNPILANKYLSNPLIKKIDFPCKLVTGITVSTTSGSIEQVEKLKKRWSADIETMESAAVFFTCLTEDVPFLCVRAISNRIEPRVKSSWKIEAAMQNLKEQLDTFINFLNRNS